MEIFQNTLDAEKFRATNAAWNSLTLNSPWSIGYVTALIESRNFKSKEDWEDFYYRSGAERATFLEKETEQIRKFMNFHILKKTKPGNIRKTPKEYKDLNYNYGRTKAQLAEKGAILFKIMQQSGFDISPDECIEAVRFRVICETWNGIMIRERNTVRNLEKKFKNISFIKTSGEFDHQYAVDYQLFKQNKLLCGIQIKPKSYTFQTNYIQKAKAANRRKNDLFLQKFNAPVIDVISNLKGRVLNRRVLEQIEKISKSFVISQK